MPEPPSTLPKELAAGSTAKLSVLVPPISVSKPENPIVELREPDIGPVSCQALAVFGAVKVSVVAIPPTNCSMFRMPPVAVAVLANKLIVMAVVFALKFNVSWPPSPSTIPVNAPAEPNTNASSPDPPRTDSMPRKLNPFNVPIPDPVTFHSPPLFGPVIRSVPVPPSTSALPLVMTISSLPACAWTRSFSTPAESSRTACGQVVEPFHTMLVTSVVTMSFPAVPFMISVSLPLPPKNLMPPVGTLMAPKLTAFSNT